MVNNIVRCKYIFVENNKIGTCFRHIYIYSPNYISPNIKLEKHISILLFSMKMYLLLTILFSIKLYAHNGIHILIIFVTNKTNLNNYNFSVPNFKETPVSPLNLLFILNLCH